MLNLMFITNRPDIAKIAERAGIDWIFVDMEFIGKDSRQKDLDSVKNHHTIADIANIKQSLTKSKLLVRVNPIHKKMDNYPSSEKEIKDAISAGADIVMLPYFKTVDEVKNFIKYVDGKAKTCLLLETPEAAQSLDKILELNGIDMIHIGLNDMHLALGKKFMFELLADGTVDMLSSKIKSKSIPFGFGGIATLRGGTLPGEMVLKEHYRLASSMVIISRSFCNVDEVENINEIEEIFMKGIAEIRHLEKRLETVTCFSENRNSVVKTVNSFVNENI